MLNENVAIVLDNHTAAAAYPLRGRQIGGKTPKVGKTTATDTKEEYK